VSEIIPFDFEEQAVRAIMRDGEPWFVAADVCRVLEILNTTDAVRRLDEDEVTLDQIEGSRSALNLISESGLYALVIRSDKPAARRFRKWITAEVLPAIRRTGRYVHPAAPMAEPALQSPGPFREAELWLSMVREARLLAGTRAGLAMWARSPLPPLNPAQQPAVAQPSPEVGLRCLAFLHRAAPARLQAQHVGDDHADALLAPLGLRLAPEGLFVANGAAIFDGSPWAAGVHRAALRALPGTEASVRRLQGGCVRGFVVPFTHLSAALEVSHA